MNNAKISKTDINKVGLNSIEDETIKNNLMGKSRFMNKKDWVDASGRKGKVRAPGLFCFTSGANPCCRDLLP